MSTMPTCVYNYARLRYVAPPHSVHSSLCTYLFVAGFPPSVGGVPWTAGLLHPEGSGTEGFFHWRPESFSDDNGGTVIKPNALDKSDKGRWHRVFDGTISLKWFGAIGDGNSHPLSERYGDLVAAQADYPFVTSLDDEIDWAAIQTAIYTAAASNVPSVCIPPGRYRLTRPIRPEVDNLTLLGSAGAILVADPLPVAPGQKYLPEAILVDKQTQASPDVSPVPVHSLTIGDLTIEVNGGSDLDDFSAGVIQLNSCKDCIVRNVRLKYIGQTPKPKEIDGIATSQGTTGLIQSCIVDGMSKAGIYVAAGTHDLLVNECEVKNTIGQIGQAGILVTGADRITINNCLSHHNGGQVYSSE